MERSGWEEHHELGWMEGDVWCSTEGGGGVRRRWRKAGNVQEGEDKEEHRVIMQRQRQTRDSPAEGALNEMKVNERD